MRTTETVLNATQIYVFVIFDAHADAEYILRTDTFGHSQIENVIKQKFVYSHFLHLHNSPEIRSFFSYIVKINKRHIS